jgi:hypothetical protein
MSLHVKTVCLILGAPIAVGLGMWGAEILLDNYKNQQWDQFIEQYHCQIIGEKPKEGFFSSAQTIYKCDNTGIYYRNK